MQMRVARRSASPQVSEIEARHRSPDGVDADTCMSSRLVVDNNGRPLRTLPPRSGRLNDDGECRRALKG